MNERKLFLIVTVASAAILALTLIGLGLYGIDLASVYLGTPWHSSLPHGRAAMALEGLIVSVTILCGSLLTAGIIALVKADKKSQKPAE